MRETSGKSKYENNSLEYLFSVSSFIVFLGTIRTKYTSANTDNIDSTTNRHTDSQRLAYPFSKVWRDAG